MTIHATALTRALTPPDQQPIWRWAESAVVLSSRQGTSFPGPYRTKLTPYVRGIFDALQDPTIQTVTVEKGAQTGLTLLAYVWLCWIIDVEPGPTLMVYPNENLARDRSRDVVQPLIEDSPVVSRQLTGRRDDWTKLAYRMKRCTVNWVGANSPANLASRPMRYLIEDETDKYPTQTKTEAAAVSLAEQRTKTFWNRKILRISTPTTEDGIIHKSFLEGDQRRYFVPCHACGAMQFLKWQQVKFDSDAPLNQAAAGAHYECEACGAEWDDVQKNAAVQQGIWQTTSDKSPGHASFHLPSICAPWVTFADLVMKFLPKKAYPNELQDFINSELGEPFIRESVRVKDSFFAEREGQYKIEQRFTDAPLYAKKYAGQDAAMFIGVDVQKECLVVCARLFAVNGDSGLYDRRLLGSFSELQEYAIGLQAYAVGIDCGYRTQEVYENALQYQFVPCKGSGYRIPAVWEQAYRNIYEGTRKQKDGITVGVITHDPNQLKDQLHDRMSGKSPFVWLIPRGLSADPDYTMQMSAEQSVNGKWVPIKEGMANHYWDAEVLCLLMATMYGYNSYIKREEEQDGDAPGR